MKIEQRDSTQERTILIGMIVDSLVLGRIASRWTERGLFNSKWSNLVGSWCVEYFNKYKKAPSKSIPAMFSSWAEHSRDKDTIQLVERFLETLSEEYEMLSEESNSNYVIDLAAKHFTRIRLTKLVDDLHADLESGFLSKAETKVTEFTKVEMGIGSCIDVLHDEPAIRSAFSKKGEALIKYPGALENFFGSSLERDGLIAFMGPEKRGKSFWLLDVAWRAMMQGKRVAYFEVGDMSQDQVMRRFLVRASHRPFEAKTIKIPTYLEHTPGDEEANVDIDERELKTDLDEEEAIQACRRVISKGNMKRPLLKLSCHPNSTISVNGILAILQEWEMLAWSPDVVVIDYADILAPISPADETREQINRTWKSLRALSQSLHCLVVTATQSDAASYRTNTLDRSNFSEDKRKLAHVTGMVGINAKPEESERGLMRLNWVVRRDGEIKEGQCVYCAGCLAIANPAIKSTF